MSPSLTFASAGLEGARWVRPAGPAAGAPMAEPVPEDLPPVRRVRKAFEKKCGRCGICLKLIHLRSVYRLYQVITACSNLSSRDRLRCPYIRGSSESKFRKSIVDSTRTGCTVMALRTLGCPREISPLKILDSECNLQNLFKWMLTLTEPMIS